eukprot:TRINITY_DN10594_c0_g1_i2.p1 TRINITY_DN10594_c0_g1~~TRINITY_DN10594_c0_g1_i2.p1  ORF type:complete len:155 (-),score=20.73 TRINITY_DN10594_c0_g1_i2:828-1292(-)
MDNLASTMPGIIPTFRTPLEMVNTHDPYHNPFAILDSTLNEPLIVNTRNNMVPPEQQMFISSHTSPATPVLLLPPHSSPAPPPVSSITSTSTNPSIQMHSLTSLPDPNTIANPLMCPLSSLLPPPTVRHINRTNPLSNQSPVSPQFDINLDGRS